MSHKETLKKLGYVVDDSHIGQVVTWRSIFERTTQDSFDQNIRYNKASGKGSVEECHDTRQQVRRREYNPHILACREWGALFFNEYTDLVLDGDDEGDANSRKGAVELDFLKQHYKRVGLWATIEEQFPEVFGVGTVAVVTEYSSHYGIQHKCFSAEAIFPIAVRQGKICSVVFVSSFKQGEEEYYLYNIHEEIVGEEKKAGGEKGVVCLPTGKAERYRITNKVVKKVKGGSAGGAGPEAVLASNFGLLDQYESEARLFAIFKPFNRRLSGFNNAFGIPVYYDCIDQIFEINSLYNVKVIDTETSRRTIFIDKGILTFDESGAASIPQHLYGVVVATGAMEVGGMGGEQKSFIHEFAPNPHIDKYSAEIQAALNRFSKAVGLGSDAFRYEDKRAVVSATQIVSDNQEKYSNLKKHHSLMAGEFVALNRAILALTNANEQTSYDLSLDIGYYIQDSVIVDDETLKKTAIEEVAAGLMSVEYYLKNHRGLTGEALSKELAQLNEARSREQSLYDGAAWRELEAQYGGAPGGQPDKTDQDGKQDEEGA